MDRPLPAGIPAYQVVTPEITTPALTGVKEALTLWHPASQPTDVLIEEIGVNMRVFQTAGSFAWELQFISGENATPGGSVITPQQLNLKDSPSALVCRSTPNAPTVLPGSSVFQRAAFPLPAAAAPWTSQDAFIVYRAKNPDRDGIMLRKGQAEGLRISQNIVAALTTAPVFSIYAKYFEF